jgi:5'-nucleotidase
VLSGINHGPNLGSDVFYSGTVSAAMEGTLEGLCSLAVSSACFDWREFTPAAVLAMDVAERVLAGGWPEGLLLNLNVPALPGDRIAPVRWCRPAVRRYLDQFDQRTDPRGRTYYWLAGEVVNDLESATAGPRDWPTDVAQVHGGGAALTPLQPELFWRRGLHELPRLDQEIGR